MRTCSSKMVPPENYCRKGCAEDHPHPHKPRRAAHSTERLGEQNERLKNDNRNNTFAFPDNDNPESPLCALSHWSLTQILCSSSSAMPLICLFFSRFLYSFAKHLQFYLHLSYHPVALYRPKKALSELFLGHWQVGENFCE